MPERDSKRSLNRRDSPPGRSLVSAEKGTDEISATGGRQCLSPLPFSKVVWFQIPSVHKTNQPPSEWGADLFGEPGGIRTHDLLIRRQDTPYPEALTNQRSQPLIF